VSFDFSFNGFRFISQLGRDVSTAECSDQYGFVPGRIFEPPENTELRTRIINQWISWFNSLTMTLTFDAERSARERSFLFWKGEVNATTPFGASAVFPFSAFWCRNAVEFGRVGEPCVSEGPGVSLSLSSFFFLSSGPCTDSVMEQTHTFVTNGSLYCALDTSSGCANFLGPEIEAYSFRFEGWCNVQVRFNPLP